MAKKCPPGKYYCFTDKKCKKIPRGYHIGARGYLARDTKEDDSETKKNGNGSSNGNGNGGNGAGNGNGGSGGNGGGNGGGGMGESIIYEASQILAIPRKPGQPAKSKKHSDLYTDEDPKGTIHGLGFKDVAKARASVSKIRNSSRSHAHKIQAAVAMEQRAREMGKTSEAAVYRKYINAMKKKTKRMNEAVNAAQQAAIAIDMKKKGKKPKSVKEEKMTPAEKRKDTMLKKKYDKSDMKKSMQKQYGKEEGKKVYFATIRKQAMESFSKFTQDGVTRVKSSLAKTATDVVKRNVTDTLTGGPMTTGAAKIGLQNLSYTTNATRDFFRRKKPVTTRQTTTGIRTAGTQIKKPIQSEENILEKRIYRTRMNPGVRNKNRVLSDAEKKIFDKSQRDTDQRVNTDQTPRDKVVKKILDRNAEKKKERMKVPNRIQSDRRRIERGMSKGEIMLDHYDDKYNVSEEGLRDWFGKSSGTTKSGRKVRGWVQVGGKYDGKPCARQPGQKSTPKCVSSSKRRSMSKSERDSAARRKRAADPNQPQKSGAAKPTNVSTDPKKKMSENYFNEAKDKKGKGSGTKDACYHKVKSRYSVWPSAYASGALVKCRKVGAANWGNKSKNEGFSPMQVAALESAGMIEIKEGQKCWKGYEKKGTKMMFGKRYENCVKKKSTKQEVEHIDEKMTNITPNAIRKRAAKSTIKKDLPKAAAGAGALAAGVAVGNKMTNTNEGVAVSQEEEERGGGKKKI